MDYNLETLHTKTSKIYKEVLTPLGNQYNLEILTPRQPEAGKPTILFLGNHSSGKSTFINFLLGDNVQKTGIAPTDDGFTILAYSEIPEDSTGPAATKRPEITFTHLDRYGPAFLSRLKLKLLANPTLETMTLVDSPGMIDAAGTGQERGYDFMAAVRSFGESADLILFFLDPEKPGTTGEAIEAFTKALHCMESKTLILMNKADTFGNIRDFARDYGALCWNLSRVIKTKDLPDIYTTYVPLPEQANQRDENRAIPLSGFDEAREEVIFNIHNTQQRRYDNVIGTLTEQSERLDMHIQVAWGVKRRMLQAKSTCAGVTFAMIAITAGFGWLYRTNPNQKILPVILSCGILLAISWWAISHLLIAKSNKRTATNLDSSFQGVYKRDLTMGQRDDLRSRWESVKVPLESAYQTIGSACFPSSNPRFNYRYRRLRKLLKTDIAKLRRSK